MTDRRTGPATLHWDVLTIGHLSRNRFWGESDDRAYREPLCTSTLIQTAEHNVVVDPGLPLEEMARILDRRAGIVPGSVDIVFLTHFHGDHRVGLDAFPHAVWYMPAAEIEHCERHLAAESPDREVLDLLRPVGPTLFPGITVLATPGHSAGHASLLFESEGMRIAVAGDAAMTRDFFVNRDYYFNTVDAEAAVTSIETLSRAADVVVPGHDNFFLNRPLE
ncbi:MAG: MBL-fold metallo-hydrolase superfamily [uncultured Thermomicrobiales bacterium]|uniref:MBL-fold metallo-hydrolase superfamily n=1 Tax=uncultured Thermomicrobiales bacterium TaxID=1645740 RepID=A0A6J4URD6_9BACT|nr:MAG: MBL-fold metallo-hydrolase superfamily [uncultured Thermomicrobiales bacterium]